MEFSGQYLTYEEYKSLGGALEEMPFNLLEYNARKEIDTATLNRLQGIGNNYNEVKMCIYDIITTLQSYENDTKKSKLVASENTDGYSISYNNFGTDTIVTKNKEINGIIRKHLFGLIVNKEHILYLGI